MQTCVTPCTSVSEVLLDWAYQITGIHKYHKYRRLLFWYLANQSLGCAREICIDCSPRGIHVNSMRPPGCSIWYIKFLGFPSRGFKQTTQTRSITPRFHLFCLFTSVVMPSLASVGLALFYLLECTVSQSLMGATKKQALDRGPSGLNLSAGAQLYVANTDGKFDTTIAQRWSDFKNPTFVGVVVVANENDIINTVRLSRFELSMLNL